MAKKTGELRGMGSLPVGGSRGGQRGMKGSLTACAALPTTHTVHDVSLN